MKKIQLKWKIVIISMSLFVFATVFFLYMNYDKMPDYTYGEDYYYTEIIDEITENSPEFNNMNSEEQLSVIRNYVYNLLHLYDDEKAVGGFYCGGVSYTLACVYNLLGYDAICLDMALFDNNNVVSSHVVTLVELDDEWIIQDACFNVEYRDLEGNLLDIQEMLEYLDDGREDLIEIVDYSDITKPLVSSNLISQEESLYDIENPRKLLNGQYIYDTKVSLSKEPFSALYPYFEKDGYNKNQIYIYEYPYAIYLVNDDIKNCWDYFTLKIILGNRMSMQ